MAPRQYSRPSPTLNSPIAVKQELAEDARLALALQKPEMELANDGVEGTITVSFVTGPQAFAGTYSIACYAVPEAPLEPPTCSTLADFQPIEPAKSGDLTKVRSTINEEFGELGSELEDQERACFITVEGAFEKADKCMMVTGAYPAPPPSPPARSLETDDRFAGAILKPAVEATADGEGLITFDSLDMIDYTYNAYCFDVTAMETDEVALPTCKDDLTDVELDGYVISTGDVANAADETKKWEASVGPTDTGVEALCFVTAEGPYEKKTTCKSAGTAILTAPTDRAAASDERLAGAIVKPKVTAIESTVADFGMGEITFETYGVSAYEITATCFDVAYLPEGELLSCKDSADFLDSEYEEARAAVEMFAPWDVAQTVDYGKTTITIGAALNAEVQCFLQAVGPLGEFESCKSAGTATLDLPLVL